MEMCLLRSFGRRLGLLPDAVHGDAAHRLYAVGFEGLIYQLDFTLSHFDETKLD